VHRHIEFTREEWKTLRASTPQTLNEEALAKLRGIDSCIELNEVSDIYLPLSRLLDLYVTATKNLYDATSEFLRSPVKKVPYIIGIAGSVAVGKSTFARILKELISHWVATPSVSLVTTDGFLYPNKILSERGLLNRKGFPESYNTRHLTSFLQQVKAGEDFVKAPIYDHVSYDIIDGNFTDITHPDVLIIEGLNVLQIPCNTNDFISDYFDFSIFIDAEENFIEEWYVKRFHQLRESVFSNPNSYFHHFSDLTEHEATERAVNIWKQINLKNLQENICPTKQRADLILHLGEDHRTNKIELRKI
jgi:type I pantothenate kinase